MRFYLFRTGHVLRTPISYLSSEKGHVAQLHLRPMTNAQRQTAYLQRQRVASISVTVTKIAIRRIKCRPCAPSWRRFAASLLSCGSSEIGYLPRRETRVPRASKLCSSCLQWRALLQNEHVRLGSQGGIMTKLPTDGQYAGKRW